MRVAVLADIHGHLPALEAVLADVDRAGADAIVVNGDIATGPLPADTLDLLASRGEQVVWVHGNAEREVVAAFDGTPDPDLTGWTERSTAYTAAAIERRHRDLIDGLPLSVTLDVDGLGPVRFCHATLRNDTDMVLVDSPIAAYAEGFAGAEEEVFVLGHTHMPFDRLADRRRFVNPGSVGMPYGGTGAYWALLGPDVTLRRTGYDLAAAADRLRAADGWPDLDEFVAENVLTVPSDAEALAAFSPNQLVARPR
jgi:predicted phosphodiesterase